MIDYDMSHPITYLSATPQTPYISSVTVFGFHITKYHSIPHTQFKGKFDLFQHISASNNWYIDVLIKEMITNSLF